MAKVRRGGRPGSGPRTLLDEVSPYESRRVTVEYDGSTTAAFLRDESGDVVGATWLANHQPAPPLVDLGRLNAGQAPLIPVAHTKHPRGRPPLAESDLSTVWFEEGDGVAIYESGQLLAVIPGWTDMDAGMPGYSRDLIGQTPFGWALDEAMEGLGPRVEQARTFWRWRRGQGAWGGFQQAVLGHLLNRLGPGAQYWDAGGGRMPMIGVTERPPTPQRPYTVLSSVGMSCQRMPVVEQYVDDVSEYGRIEMALGTTMPSQQAARVFLWLAQYPWRSMTWFGPGHSVRWYHAPDTFPLGGGCEAVLLLDDPERLLGPPPPDLSGLTFGGDAVRWLWIVPITEEERLLARERGSGSLVTQLAAKRRTWLAEPAPPAG